MTQDVNASFGSVFPGIAITVLSVPLPTYVTKLLRMAHIEKMKKVCSGRLHE